MAKLFADPCADLSFQITPGVALESSVIVTRYKSSTPHLPAENHVFFRRSLFESHLPKKVSVIAVGGTGHSPWPEGYIGEGMLTAAVTGATFMAPSPEAIRATMEFVANRSSGMLVVAVSHQNDEFNVTDAVRDFKRMGSMCPVEVVPVLDEAVSKRSRRARGLAGSVFVLKIAGAVAEMHGTISEVYNIASRVAASVVTYAAASVTCSSTGRDATMFTDGIVELGVGVHGEAGEEPSFTPSPDYPFDVVKNLCARVYDSLAERIQGQSIKREGTVLMINNLGSLSPSEMLIISHAVSRFITERRAQASGIDDASLATEIYSGCFMSALGAIGFSVSGLNVLDKRWLELLHVSTKARGWQQVSCVYTQNLNDLPIHADFTHFERILPEWSNSNAGQAQASSSSDTRAQGFPIPGHSYSTESVKSLPERCVLAVADALMAHADKMKELDRKHGNQSLGTDAKRLGEALSDPNNLQVYAQLAKTDPVEILNKVGQTARVAMQGSFGKFIEVFMTEMGSFLRFKRDEDRRNWRNAFAHATAVLSGGLGNSQGPEMQNRTMIAALGPAAHYLPQPDISLSDACAVAWDGCFRTCDSKRSLFGRGRAINETHLSGVPDPGAWFVCACLDAIREILDPCDVTS